MALNFREDKEDKRHLEIIMRSMKIKTKTKAMKLSLRMAANILSEWRDGE